MFYFASRCSILRPYLMTSRRDFSRYGRASSFRSRLGFLITDFMMRLHAEWRRVAVIDSSLLPRYYRLEARAPRPLRAPTDVGGTVGRPHRRILGRLDGSRSPRHFPIEQPLLLPRVACSLLAFSAGLYSPMNLMPPNFAAGLASRSLLSTLLMG